MNKRNLHKSMILFIILFLFGCNNNEKPNTNSLTENVEAYLSRLHENGKFNGSVLICKNDSVIYSSAYGLANREFSISNNDSTTYLIGSITKPFTAMAVLLLEQDGKLKLNNKLSDYFPDFPQSETVTIDMLLTHTSGIRDYHYLPDWIEISKLERTPQYTIDRVAELPYDFEPGTKFRYSNSGYILLGLIIEKVSGLSFVDYVNTKIIEPLELTNTGIIDNLNMVNGLASGYSTNLRTSEKAEFINYYQPFSSGNMYSTTYDLWKFTKAVMKNKLLSEEKTKSLFTSGLGSYGYGWGIRDYDSVMAYGHLGAMNGYVGGMTYIPDGEYFIAFLTNDDNTQRYTFAENLAKIVTGKEVDLPEKKKLINLTSKQIEPHLGKYMIKPGDTLDVFMDDGEVYMKETGQQKQELFPIGANKYTFSVLEMDVVFEDKANGKSQVLKLVGKKEIVAKRVDKEWSN